MQRDGVEGKTVSARVMPSRALGTEQKACQRPPVERTQKACQAPRRGSICPCEIVHMAYFFRSGGVVNPNCVRLLALPDAHS